MAYGVRDSVASAVRGHILRDPCLLECIARGIVNHSELARRVAEELEADMGKRPSEAAVKMAIHRLVKRVSADESPAVKRILASSALIVQDSVTVITVPRENMQRALSAATALANRTRFIQVTQGFRTATIVVASEDADNLISQVGEPVEVVGDQAAIILISPEEIIRTPGFIAFVTGYLSRQGINITQIISCYTETVIVLDSGAASKAYRILHSLISRLKLEGGEPTSQGRRRR